MKTKFQTQFQLRFQVAWDRLFKSLPKDRRQAILRCPEGVVASKVTGQALAIAEMSDEDYADWESSPV